MINEIEKKVLKALNETDFNDEDLFCGLTKEELTGPMQRLAALGLIKVVMVEGPIAVAAYIEPNGRAFLKSNNII